MRTIPVLPAAYLHAAIFFVCLDLIFDPDLLYLHPRARRMLFRHPLMWPLFAIIEMNTIIVKYETTGDDFGDYLAMIDDSPDYKTPRERTWPVFLSRTVPCIIFFAVMVVGGFWISN
jgi:hypothetical protein